MAWAVFYAYLYYLKWSFKHINRIPASSPLTFSPAYSPCQGPTRLLYAKSTPTLLYPSALPTLFPGLELCLGASPVGLLFVMEVTAHLSHPQRALLLADVASSFHPESGVNCHISPFTFHHSLSLNLKLSLSFVWALSAASAGMEVPAGSGTCLSGSLDPELRILPGIQAQWVFWVSKLFFFITSCSICYYYPPFTDEGEKAQRGTPSSLHNYSAQKPGPLIL